MVRNMVVRYLFPHARNTPGQFLLVSVRPMVTQDRRYRRTLWKKNRPIQPSVGRSTVDAAPRRKDHSPLRKWGIVGSEWCRKVTITVPRTHGPCQLCANCSQRATPGSPILRSHADSRMCIWAVSER